MGGSVRGRRIAEADWLSASPGNGELQLQGVGKLENGGRYPVSFSSLCTHVHSYTPSTCVSNTHVPPSYTHTQGKRKKKKKNLERECKARVKPRDLNM